MELEDGAWIPPAVEQAREESRCRVRGDAGSGVRAGMAKQMVVVEADPRSTAREALEQPVFDPAVLDDIEQVTEPTLVLLGRDDIAEAGDGGVGGLVEDEAAAIVGRPLGEVVWIGGDHAGGPVEGPRAASVAGSDDDVRLRRGESGEGLEFGEQGVDE